MSFDRRGRVLAVVTSASEFRSSGQRTGLWLSELSHFHDEMRAAGRSVDVVSVLGGEVPIDPVSVSEPMLLGSVGKRYRSREFMDELRDTRSIDDVVAEDYDAVYLAGGHGAMYDLAVDSRLAALVTEIAERGAVVSAVCHGVCGLLEVSVGGRSLVQGRQMTGYSWLEEKLAMRSSVVPFNLEDELIARGAKYSKAKIPMASHVVTDRHLVTGQNPASARGVAKAVLGLLA